MVKLTKSLPIIKERNCSASLVLDTRTNRKNVSEYPLAIRFTVDRKFFYHHVGGSYSEKRFSDICNATKSSSENYKEQKMWREEIVPKYKKMLVNLNKGNPFTYEMVRVTITTGNTNTEIAKEDKSFIGIWKEYIYHLQYDDNGKRYSTSESYISALKSFQKFLGEDAIKGFNISVVEIQKWKDCMANGIKGKDGNIEGQISESTIGIYLRSCRTIWNVCRSQGYLLDVTYPFSNKRRSIWLAFREVRLRRKSILRESNSQNYTMCLSTRTIQTHGRKAMRKGHITLLACFWFSIYAMVSTLQMLHACSTTITISKQENAHSFSTARKLPIEVPMIQRL